MNRLVIAIFLCCAALNTVRAARAAEPLPNLVVIFIDDMGYADVHPLGNPPYPTPCIAQMAKEGRCFTDFQVSSAVCSASRAGLLTGCYHTRVGIRGALGPKADIGINADEMTLAELCKQRGYATACIGKWHLGHHPKFLPTNHGFDSYFGLPYSNDMWPYHPDVLDLPMAERLKRWPNLPLIENTTVVNKALTHRDQELLTCQYTEHAVDFIRKNHDRPFFLYLAHNMVHVPLHVSKRFRGRSRKGLFGDVVMEVDWSVGQVLQTLKQLNIDKRTLVIFTSDNGPWLSYGTHAGSAGSLREGKGTSFEGGNREPTIMRWPGHIPAGTTCDELASTIDILPTFAEVIGAELPSHPIDGKDVRPLMFANPGAQSPHDYFYYYYADDQLQAVRDRRWKLHFPHRYRTLNGRKGRNDGIPIKYDHEEIQLALYDLKHDRAESSNLVEEHPEVVDRLQAAAEVARNELGDALTHRQGSGVRPVGKLGPDDARFKSMIRNR